MQTTIVFGQTFLAAARNYFAGTRRSLSGMPPFFTGTGPRLTCFVYRPVGIGHVIAPKALSIRRSSTGPTLREATTAGLKAVRNTRQEKPSSQKARGSSSNRLSGPARLEASRDDCAEALLTGANQRPRTSGRPTATRVILAEGDKAVNRRLALESETGLCVSPRGKRGAGITGIARSLPVRAVPVVGSSGA